MIESVQIDVASQFADDDPVARLIVHYFYPADLMREHHREAILGLDPGRVLRHGGTARRSATGGCGSPRSMSW